MPWETAGSSETFLRPLADKKHFEHVMGFIPEGTKEGSEILTGGARRGDRGQSIEPIIVMNPINHSKLFTDEIFGPVLTIKTFKTEKEAIRIGNDTIFVLSGECGYGDFILLDHEVADICSSDLHF